nr:histidine kinase [Chitinophagaceae bacterium]
ARGQLAEASQWFAKALATCPAPPAAPDVRAAILTNKANMLVMQQQEEAATPLLTEALGLAQKANNLNIEATALRIKSQLHMQQGTSAAAEESLLAMFAVRNRIHKISVLNDEYLQLAAFYETNGQLDKAIAVCLRQIRQGSIHGNEQTEQLYTNEIKLRLPYYEALAGYYGKLGNKEEQIKYLQEANMAKDSLYAANTAEAIEALNTQYAVQKKENLIMQQQLAMNRQNMLLYGGIMLAGFAAVLGTLLFWQYKRRQRERLQLALAEEKRLAEAAVKQAEENERKRIAADLHDNLGAYGAALNANIETLAGQINSQSAPLQQIQTNVRSIVSEIGNTIWVLQKEAQDLIDVFDKLKRWAQQLVDNYPAIQLRFSEAYQQEWMLTPTQALHTYHLLQESINNACKHSGASIITIRLNAHAEKWELSVSDNGHGFDPQAPYHGNGMRHLRQRAAQAALQLRIASGPDGTHIVLSNSLLAS